MADTQIIEMNGVKVEVDLREARTIETLKVGDAVRLLKKSSYGDPKIYSGVIIAFEPFPEHPVIVCAYLEETYSAIDLHTVNISPATKDWSIIKLVDEYPVPREKALSLFDKQIAKKQLEIDDLMLKRSYFDEKFGAYWQNVTPVASAS